MKKLLTIICLAFFLGPLAFGSAGTQQEQSNTKSIQIWYSPDLQDLVFSLSEAYKEVQKGSGLQLNLLESNKSSGWISSGQIALVSKEGLKGLDIHSSRLNVIGREVYVPVMNSGNPFIAEICKQGLSPSDFASFYSEDKTTTWGMALNIESKTGVRAYSISDPSFTGYLEAFTGQGMEKIQQGKMESCDAVLKALKKDKYAIGFCTLSQLSMLQNSENLSGIAIIPIDLNENNQLDHFEEIYGSTEELSRGIWIGKYSTSLYSRIYAVSAMESSEGPALDFIRWLASDGQELVSENGYSTILLNEQKATLASLENPAGYNLGNESEPKNASIGLLLLCLIVGGGVLGFLLLLVFNSKDTTINVKPTRQLQKLHSAYDIPGGYFFDRSHTWTFLEKDGNIRVGIDSFLQRVTGKITRVDMKGPGEKVAKGETIVALIQNGKRMEIKSPISGIIHAQNQNLQAESELINFSPFSDGWLYIVEPTNWADEFPSLFISKKYGEWVKSEIERLKDFLSSIFKSNSEPAVVLQEGGEIVEGVLGDMGPEAWEEFQINFLKN